MADILCDDWRCPERASCALHLWRSRAYAGMHMPGPETKRYDRPAEADACSDYRCDQPKPWFM